MIASIASPESHLAFLSSTHCQHTSCQSSTFDLLIASWISPLRILTLSHLLHCSGRPPQLSIVFLHPFISWDHIRHRTTSTFCQKMASSGDVKYPAVNGPGKVCQIHFLLCTDVYWYQPECSPLGMTYSDAFRHSLLPLFWFSGVRVHDDASITSNELRPRRLFRQLRSTDKAEL